MCECGQKIAESIERMFLRPSMYAQDGKELESMVLVAMSCWCMTQENVSDRMWWKLWREDVEAECKKKENPCFSVASLASIYENRTSLIIEGLKRIWEKLKSEPRTL
jgi:hypothetical protein